MKKLAAWLAALTLACTAVLTAFAEPTVVLPDPMKDYEPAPDTAGADVLLSAGPDYMLTIPSIIELNGGDDEIYRGTAKVVAAKVFIGENERLAVSLESASGFNMTNTSGGTAKLAYTAETTAFGKVGKTAGGKVAQFGNSNSEQTAEISFSTDTAPEFAGSYTDQVTFNIAIENTNS